MSARHSFLRSCNQSDSPRGVTSSTKTRGPVKMASSSSCCRVLATTTRHFHPRPRPLPPPERYCLRIGDRDASSNQTLKLRLKTATHSCWRRRVTESEIEVESTSSSSSSDVSAEKLVPWEWGVLVSPFFFWGTAMVAMKQVLPKAGPFFVSSFRLIPAGLLIIAYAASRGRKQPSGFSAWLSIFVFALVDAACFQGFLAEGLQRTSAGLGSVIIDSQPLTVAVLAALLFGESIGFIGAAGLVLGLIGLLLLEVPAFSVDGSNFSLWGSGEWWMLLAAQSMAVGTVMIRWVTKYSDPVMATGWHMVIGGLPLVLISILNHDPALSGSFNELTSSDLLALLYTSIFGSAISYSVFFYYATRGSLTKLSSLTFLTPMFASIFGFLYLGETLSPLQLVGALVTILGIYMVNYRDSSME